MPALRRTDTIAGMRCLPDCPLLVAGTDLSPGGQAAVCLGVAWSERLDAPLGALHALSGDTPAGETRSALEAAIGAQLQDAGSGGGARLVLAPGGAADALRDQAAAGAWLVVGCEGSSATLLRRAGRIASGLAHSPPGPVVLAPLGWTQPARTRHRAPAGARVPSRRRGPALPERILVGLSGSRGDARLVDAAVALAGGSGHLALARIVDVSSARHRPPTARADSRIGAQPRVTEARASLLDVAADLPLELCSRHDVRIHVIEQGPADRDLGGLARSQSIDLIVVGGGPIAAGLVASAPCPVLVLPH